MRLVAALLAAVLAALSGASCGDGAEPGAPRGATLVLDFQPNAVHAGLYAAQARGHIREHGVDLDIREPSGTADGARLLRAGRTDLAILDINDFGLARGRGFEIVAIAAIVQRPLASVIAADERRIRTPANLAGTTIGVTGVPSDDAVLDTILAAEGVSPQEVERQTIGFESVRLLAAGKVAAATAFWNAEGVALRREGVAIREFRVDEFGAPRYPELVLVAPSELLNEDSPKSSTACGVLRGLERAYAELGRDPRAALDELLEAAPDLDPGSQRAQLESLIAADAFSPLGEAAPNPLLDPAAVRPWIEWADGNDLLPDAADEVSVREGFRFEFAEACLSR